MNLNKEASTVLDSSTITNDFQPAAKSFGLAIGSKLSFSGLQAILMPAHQNSPFSSQNKRAVLLISKLTTFLSSQPSLMTQVTKLTVSYISIPISALIPICPSSFEPQPYSFPFCIKATEYDSQLLIFLTSNFSSSLRYSKCLFMVGTSQFLLFPSPKAAYSPLPQLYTSFFSLKTIQKFLPAAILWILCPSKALTFVGLDMTFGISLP